MKHHQWNTKRMYADDGQRMVAQVTETEILFSDLARHINGSIPLGKYLQRAMHHSHNTLSHTQSIFNPRCSHLQCTK